MILSIILSIIVIAMWVKGPEYFIFNCCMTVVLWIVIFYEKYDFFKSKDKNE